MQEYIERNCNGDKLWRVGRCSNCNGKGRQWYPGCDDGAASCNGCEGMGQVGKFRWLDKNGEPHGPWLNCYGE